MAGRATVTISVRHMPEVLAEMRLELARLLRDVARDEAPVVQHRLEEVAAKFEAGLTAEGLQ